MKWMGLGLGLVSAVVSALIFFESMGSFKRLSSLAVHTEPEEKAVAEKSAHGEESSAGHGETAHGESHGRETASAPVKGMVPFMSLDEIFANINQEKYNHTLALKVDVEFFSLESKQTFKSKQPAVKNLIIQTSREQEYDQLASLSGKLYYKELLIRRINEYFQEPLVKDIHFVSFFLQ